MATDFRTLIESLKDYGFFDIVLPFLLVFTLIFAILEKTKLLGLEGQNAKTNINAILSLVISFIFIANTDVSQVINSYISNVGLLIVIALLGLVLFGLLGVNVEQGFRGIPLLIAVILAIIGLIWSLKDQTYLGINFGNLGSSGYLDGPLIVTIVVIIIVLFVLLRQGKSFDTDKFSEGVDKQFGKGGQKR
ncbi:hypothetical protein J4455_01085 [Candidatus Woesearchaeota archaeon]|nr:hypothetical protein [Candidatus Woesearchaeota archaeon]